jgi:hypothetical protein
MGVLGSAQMSGCHSRDRTTLQRTDASQMNATDVMLAEPATAHGASMVDENVPDAPLRLASILQWSLRLAPGVPGRPTC